MNYSLSAIELHWHHCEISLAKKHKDWNLIFREIVPLVGEVLSSLEGRQKLAENCTYLLLSKGLNHSLATYTLLAKGMLIDSSLTARNALETFLMLELFVTDPTENYFKKWANGQEFKPSEIRSKLGSSLHAVVREVEITFDDDYYETVKMAYSFWSDITHSNLKSPNYIVKKRPDGTFSVPTGGSLHDQDALVNCLFAVMCSGLLRVALISSAIVDLKLLEALKIRFSKLQTQVSATAKARNSNDNTLLS